MSLSRIRSIVWKVSNERARILEQRCWSFVIVHSTGHWCPFSGPSSSSHEPPAAPWHLRSERVRASPLLLSAPATASPVISPWPSLSSSVMISVLMPSVTPVRTADRAGEAVASTQTVAKRARWRPSRHRHRHHRRLRVARGGSRRHRRRRRDRGADDLRRYRRRRPSVRYRRRRAGSESRGLLITGVGYDLFRIGRRPSQRRVRRQQHVLALATSNNTLAVRYGINDSSSLSASISTVYVTTF